MERRVTKEGKKGQRKGEGGKQTRGRRGKKKGKEGNKVGEGGKQRKRRRETKKGKEVNYGGEGGKQRKGRWETKEGNEVKEIKYPGYAVLSSVALAGSDLIITQHFSGTHYAKIDKHRKTSFLAFIVYQLFKENCSHK